MELSSRRSSSSSDSRGASPYKKRPQERAPHTQSPRNRDSTHRSRSPYERRSEALKQRKHSPPRRKSLERARDLSAGKRSSDHHQTHKDQSYARREAQYTAYDRARHPDHLEQRERARRDSAPSHKDASQHRHVSPEPAPRDRSRDQQHRHVSPEPTPRDRSRDQQHRHVSPERAARDRSRDAHHQHQQQGSKRHFEEERAAGTRVVGERRRYSEEQQRRQQAERVEGSRGYEQQQERAGRRGDERRDGAERRKEAADRRGVGGGGGGDDREARHRPRGSERSDRRHTATAATAPTAESRYKPSDILAAMTDPLEGKHDVDYRRAGEGRGGPKSSFSADVAASACGAYASHPSRGLTRSSTHARFTPLNADSRDFKPKDLISIGIERKIAGDEPAVIPPHLRAQDVVVRRRKDEGSTPLCARAEFESRDDESEDEAVEKRVVKVMRAPGAPEPQRKKKKFEPENFEVRRNVPSLSERWTDNSPEDTQRQPSTSLRHGDRDERLVTSSERRRRTGSAEAGSRERKGRAHSPKFTLTISDMDERIVADKHAGRDSELPRDPNDLRYNLSRKRAERPFVDAREKLRLRRGEEGVRAPERGGSERGGGEWREAEEGDSRRVARRNSHSPGGSELPDFSKRPGKYNAWQSNPEMIPRSNYYFEHDNRDDPAFLACLRARGRASGRFIHRGAGRGGYRGGGFRDVTGSSYYRGSSGYTPRGGGYDRGGGYRGRWTPRHAGTGRGFVPRSSQSGFDSPWKHDKFEEIEQPSSTTE